MKKQLHKIKIAAENFSRPTKPDKNSEELLAADRHVEKYKEVLDRICKKFLQNPTSSSSNNQNTTNVDQDAREKRCKKVHEFKLAQAMEESIKDLPDGLLREVLDNCAKLEKNIAAEIVNNEINVENDVTKKLGIIMDTHITTIQKQKRIVTKLMQDNESAKHKYQAALRLNESMAKINQLREEQEECESKLEKERDIWAAEMFELIAEEDNMANYILNYIKYQQLYYKSALDEIEDVVENINHLIKGNNRKIFKVPLETHLAVTNRTISYVIELCVCCLLEKGLYEEGLLRVGCAGTKLRRLKSAIDANLVTTPYPSEYQDVHVIASVLKSYLRDLPEPLLTYRLYNEFIGAAQMPTDEKRKTAILNAINKLPQQNYINLRYLAKFLDILSQKQKFNKMSPQNIAIVMAPNLLWASEASDGDYMAKVNSTASVNVVVEALIADWTYFFGDEFPISDFYVTLSRDELFPDNGGFPFDRDPQVENCMTKSLNVNTSNDLTSNSNNHGIAISYPAHSRSSSHDTSLILLGGNNLGIDEGLSKRSQSNSSLSDSSPPQQGSPKLPVRRKHNKQAAPTPPDNRMNRSMEHYSTMHQENQLQNASNSNNNSSVKERFFNVKDETLESKDHSSRFIKNEANAQSNSTVNAFKPPHPVSMKQYHGSTENLISKPDKPPRPAMPTVESQTLVRNAFKNKGAEKPGRPVALPRKILNVTRSTENLSMSSSSSPIKTPSTSNSTEAVDQEGIVLREKNQITTGEHNRLDSKPAIPERPTSLMKPSFRTAVFDKFETQQHIIQKQQNDQTGGIKKAQSFRMSSNGQLGGNNNGSEKSQAALERTHIYNVDKQQVAFIDVNEQQSNNGGGNNENINIANNDGTTNTKVTNVKEDENASVTENVPQSPRNFDPKLIKRPQIPPPPKPALTTSSTEIINQGNENLSTTQKTDGNPGDSTKL